MCKLRHILSAKGRDVITAQPTMSVFDAIRVMAQRNVGALLVLDDGKIVGLFSERDYLRKIALKFRSSRKTPVADVMSSPVLTANLDDEVEHCMELMTDHRYRHLPVMDGERLCGIVSIGDLVKSMLEQKNQEVAQLNEYIAGGY